MNPDRIKIFTGSANPATASDPATDAIPNEPVGIPERNIVSALHCGCEGGEHHHGD